MLLPATLMMIINLNFLCIFYFYAMHLVLRCCEEIVMIY